MALPIFYISSYDNSQKEFILEEETSKHIVQVLRMKVGQQLNLTDGKGNLLTCEISLAHKKKCEVTVKTTRNQQQKTRMVSIAISLLKNPNRFEWFLEKATEIGVTEIIPLICERTEKEKFRFERMHGICISAMLQSQQVWLPELHEPVELNKVIIEFSAAQKFIAYCSDGYKSQLTMLPINQSSLILIGPEGDFTPDEIKLAAQHNFLTVSLGETRLRTETAGVVAAALLCQI